MKISKKRAGRYGTAIHPGSSFFIVNDIGYFVFGLAEAAVYGCCKNRKHKFVMVFTIS